MRTLYKQEENAQRSVAFIREHTNSHFKDAFKVGIDRLVQDTTDTKLVDI